MNNKIDLHLKWVLQAISKDTALFMAFHKKVNVLMKGTTISTVRHLVDEIEAVITDDTLEAYRRKAILSSIRATDTVVSIINSASILEIWEHTKEYHIHSVPTNSLIMEPPISYHRGFVPQELDDAVEEPTHPLLVTQPHCYSDLCDELATLMTDELSMFNTGASIHALAVLVLAKLDNQDPAPDDIVIHTAMKAVLAPGLIQAFWSHPDGTMIREELYVLMGMLEDVS